ncbi:hypothetical protein AYI70_g3204 [Smittium culicis]|uniref:Uncharacterized protein n=1 Tax=Smittium culicis TaxID=133412 RepID=A0A1R1Y502_9FUNG|nr:hypothetical protein AYI70_g3204 [Smittium culicis]
MAPGWSVLIPATPNKTSINNMAHPHISFTLCSSVYGCFSLQCMKYARIIGFPKHSLPPPPIRQPKCKSPHPPIPLSNYSYLPPKLFYPHITSLHNASFPLQEFSQKSPITDHTALSPHPPTQNHLPPKVLILSHSSLLSDDLSLCLSKIHPSLLPLLLIKHYPSFESLIALLSLYHFNAQPLPNHQTSAFYVSTKYYPPSSTPLQLRNVNSLPYSIPFATLSTTPEKRNTPP